MAGIKEGVKVAKAKVGSGAMAAEGVKVPAANENELGDPKGGGAPSQSAYVVSLGYVMHHHVALYHHFPFCFFNFYSILLVIPNALNWELSTIAVVLSQTPKAERKLTAAKTQYYPVSFCGFWPL